MISSVMNWLFAPLPTWCLFVGMVASFVVGYVASGVLKPDVSVTVTDRD